MHSAQLYAVKYMRFRPDERLKYIEILIKSPQQVFEKEQQVKEVLFFMKLKTRLAIAFVTFSVLPIMFVGLMLSVGRLFSTCPWKESHRI